MSGHSKWSKVKHQKAVTDVVKSKYFSKASRDITVAVREGGGVTDINGNFRLRLAVEKARAVNMPRENIERAIQKAAGEGGVAFEKIIYEGYGPGGIAVLIFVTTDNPRRSASAVKNILERNGGSLGQPGAVSYLFTHAGYLRIAREARSFDSMVELALGTPCIDVFDDGEVVEVITAFTDFHKAVLYFESNKCMIEHSGEAYIPKQRMELEDEAHLASFEALHEALGENDDVTAVVSTLDEIGEL
jgi:YebC/PmpR family DNA-binding regulatory protein